MRDSLMRMAPPTRTRCALSSRSTRYPRLLRFHAVRLTATRQRLTWVTRRRSVSVGCARHRGFCFAPQLVHTHA